MSEHDPSGSTLCIHSVCVAVEHRRKGLATSMLTQYCQNILQDRNRSPAHSNPFSTQADIHSP